MAAWYSTRSFAALAMDLLLGLDEEDVDVLGDPGVVEEHHELQQPVHAERAAPAPAGSDSTTSSDPGGEGAGNGRLQAAGGPAGLMDAAHCLEEGGRLCPPCVSVRVGGCGSLGMYAQRDFAAGEVVFTEKPQLTAVINPAVPHCEWCMRSLAECPPELPHAHFWPAAPRQSSCDACRARFCCSTCRRHAEEAGHARLCGAISSGELAAFEASCRELSHDALWAGVALLVVRMLAHLLLAAEGGDGERRLEEARRGYAHLTRGCWGDEGGGRYQDGAASATRALFSRVMALLRVTLDERRWLDEPLMRDLFRAAAVNTALLQPINPFADYVTASRTVRRGDGGATLRALEAHGDELRARHGARLEGAQTLDEVHADVYGVRGGAVFKLHSKLNHSCEPNAKLVCAFTESTIDVVAKTDIRAGDELTIGYVEPSLDLGRRRQTLRSCYGFDCACARCEREQRLGGA